MPRRPDRQPTSLGGAHWQRAACPLRLAALDRARDLTPLDPLRAVTSVTVEDVRFTLGGARSRCFNDARARRLVGTLTMTGPVQDTVKFNQELRLDRTEVTLLDRREGAGSGAQQQSVIFQAEFAGQVDTVSGTYNDTEAVLRSLFTSTDGCQGRLTYKITFQRR